MQIDPRRIHPYQMQSPGHHEPAVIKRRRSIFRGGAGIKVRQRAAFPTDDHPSAIREPGRPEGSPDGAIGRLKITRLQASVVRLDINHIGQRPGRRHADVAIALPLALSHIGEPIRIQVPGCIETRSRIKPVLNFSSITHAIAVGVRMCRETTVKVF